MSAFGRNRTFDQPLLTNLDYMSTRPSVARAGLALNCARNPFAQPKLLSIVGEPGVPSLLRSEALYFCIVGSDLGIDCSAIHHLILRLNDGYRLGRSAHASAKSGGKKSRRE
jgi:hypothetical protein